MEGFDWDAMNRLHEKGYISDPVGKAKSVVFTEEGMPALGRTFPEDVCDQGRVRFIVRRQSQMSVRIQKGTLDRWINHSEIFRKPCELAHTMISRSWSI